MVWIVRMKLACHTLRSKCFGERKRIVHLLMLVAIIAGLSADAKGCFNGCKIFDGWVWVDFGWNEFMHVNAPIAYYVDSWTAGSGDPVNMVMRVKYHWSDGNPDCYAIYHVSLGLSGGHIVYNESLGFFTECELLA